jgi:hypothetical protein
MEFEDDNHEEDGDGAYGDSLTQANLSSHNGDDDVSLTQCAVMEPMEAMKMQYEEQGPESVDCVGIIIEDDHNRKEPAYFFLADGTAKLGSDYRNPGVCDIRLDGMASKGISNIALMLKLCEGNLFLKCLNSVQTLKLSKADGGTRILMKNEVCNIYAGDTIIHFDGATREEYHEHHIFHFHNAPSVKKKINAAADQNGVVVPAAAVAPLLAHAGSPPLPIDEELPTMRGPQPKRSNAKKQVLRRAKEQRKKVHKLGKLVKHGGSQQQRIQYLKKTAQFCLFTELEEGCQRDNCPLKHPIKNSSPPPLSGEQTGMITSWYPTAPRGAYGLIRSSANEKIYFRGDSIVDSEVENIRCGKTTVTFALSGACPKGKSREASDVKIQK